jgi:mannose-6-phosphate isomerase-like protein (cupin superfamily)
VQDINALLSTVGERKIVQKLWGMEDWVVNTPSYCGKVLVMNEGWQSSLHYHPVKDETMLAISGACVVEVFLSVEKAIAREGGEYVLLAHDRGSALRLPPTTPHRFMTTLGEGCTLVEFSTTHSDEDVVRLEDSQLLYAGRNERVARKDRLPLEV